MKTETILNFFVAMRNQTEQQRDWEKQIGEKTRNGKRYNKNEPTSTKYTFGYIGNFERWGDDRLLILWDGLKNSVWKCAAVDMTENDFNRAMKILS